tara:strand:+ start:444 stop:761 length:318 start_codon:yes stop_codon:yes gene_type:complete
MAKEKHDGNCPPGTDPEDCFSMTMGGEPCSRCLDNENFPDAKDNSIMTDPPYDGSRKYQFKNKSNDRAFSTGWSVIKDQCCDNKRMVERKDGTRRCRTCGTTERD